MNTIDKNYYHEQESSELNKSVDQNDRKRKQSVSPIKNNNNKRYEYSDFGLRRSPAKQQKLKTFAKKITDTILNP